MKKTNTELLCNALGWQGGTVHQVAQETGLSVHDIIYTKNVSDEKEFDAGWSALAQGRIQEMKSEKQGNLAWWLGVAAAQSRIK